MHKNEKIIVIVRIDSQICIKKARGRPIRPTTGILLNGDSGIRTHYPVATLAINISISHYS